MTPERSAEEGRHSATPDEGRDRSGTDSKGLHLYAVLGLPKDCNEDDIKRAYRKLALRFHPDKISGDDPARHEKTEKFKEINHANAILSNPKKRKIYDQMGEPGLKLMEQFGEDNERLLSWMLKPWFKWVFFGFGILTCGFFCCCCGCMCCCKCCCNFCCGKYTPAEADEYDADDFDDGGEYGGPHVIVVQPGQSDLESASPQNVDPAMPSKEPTPSRPAVIAMPPPPPEYGSNETSH